MRLLFLLDNEREDVPDVPDVPELLVEHDASELFERFDVNEMPAWKLIFGKSAMNLLFVGMKSIERNGNNLVEFLPTGHIR